MLSLPYELRTNAFNYSHLSVLKQKPVFYWHFLRFLCHYYIKHTSQYRCLKRDTDIYCIDSEGDRIMDSMSYFYHNVAFQRIGNRVSAADTFINQT